MPRPGASVTAISPPTICGGSLVNRSRPSCQIQWVSRALCSPGAAAPQCATIASEDVEEGTRGLRCVGVALRYNNPVMDAISCSVPIERMTAERLEQIASALTRTARKLEDSAPVQGTL